MKEELLWLRRCEPFCRASEAELARLAAASRLRRLESGEMLVRAGSPQTEIANLVDGTVAIYRTNRARGITLLLGVLSAPAIFGDAECLLGAPWIASVRAETDIVCVMIRNEAFLRILQGDGALAYKMYVDASIRHALANHTAQTLALHGVDVRMLRILLDYASLYGRKIDDDVHVGRKITQADLAAALGVTIRTVRRTVLALERQGALTRDETGAPVVKGLSTLEGRIPGVFFGLTSRFGASPPRVLSRWQAHLDDRESGSDPEGSAPE